MRIKFILGPYGYEVVLGNISEQIYNKYSQDNDALRDAVTGFEEDTEIKEWSDMDDIVTLNDIQKKGFNIKEDIKHSLEEDLSDKFYFFGQSGEKGEWENLDQLFEVSEFKSNEFNIHIANLDGLKMIYAISYKDMKKTQLSVESSNPNFQNFEVRMGDDV